MADLAGANPGRRMDIEIAVSALDRLGMMYGGIAPRRGPMPEAEPPEPEGSEHLDDEEEEEEEEEEPNPTGNTNLGSDDLAIKQADPHVEAAQAIKEAAQAVEQVNQELLTRTREASDNGRD